MTGRLILATFAAFALVCVPLLAHEGHDHKILGTVTMAAADHVMLKDKTGKEVTVHITGTTKVMRNKKPSAVDEIKAGTRVVITAVAEKVNNAQRFTAKLIELGKAPATK
jgi:hypothetical protein